MAFQIKDMVSIAAGMLNHMRGTQNAITDFNIGSVARTMIEAPSIEMDEVYQQMLNGLREAIPVATYNSFNFDRQPANPASGVVRATITASASEVIIQAGTLFTTPASRVTYTSLEERVIAPGGTYADMLVTAQAPGVAGNIPAGSTFVVAPAPGGFVSAQNLTAFTNGQDIETDEQRKQRFALFISTLSRATVAALDYGARTVIRRDALGAELERVRAVGIVEPYLVNPLNPPALVNLYVHNGVGSTTAGLVALTSTVLHGYVDGTTGEKIPGWKAAGVKLVVAAATEQTQAITGTLSVGPGYVFAEVKSAVELALAGYVAGLDIGKPFVHADAIYIVKSIPGVVDFIFSVPTGNVTCDANEKIVVGAITITAIP